MDCVGLYVNCSRFRIHLTITISPSPSHHHYLTITISPSQLLTISPSLHHHLSVTISSSQLAITISVAQGGRKPKERRKNTKTQSYVSTSQVPQLYCILPKTLTLTMLAPDGSDNKPSFIYYIYISIIDISRIQFEKWYNIHRNQGAQAMQNNSLNVKKFQRL